MKISIISVTPSSKMSKAGKPYQNVEVIYKDLDAGKVGNKNITQYGAVFKQVADAQPGQTFDVTNVKNGEFWEWSEFVRDMNAAVTANVTPAQAVTQSSGKTSWETSDERAAKQVYIIKQSSLSTAVAALSVGAKTPPTFEQIKTLAQQLTDFVLNKEVKDIFSEANDLEVE